MSKDLLHFRYMLVSEDAILLGVVSGLQKA